MSKRITFKPYEIILEVPDGENLLRAALHAGVHINASCGGEGVCGKCRVLLESGELTSTRSGLISDEDWDLGYRQACQSWVDADVVIRIPPESLLDRRTLTRRRAGIGLRSSPIDLAAMKAQGLYNPAFQKKFVELPPPSLADNACDLSRLEQGLARQHGLDNLAHDFFMLRKLAAGDAGGQLPGHRHPGLCPAALAETPDCGPRTRGHHPAALRARRGYRHHHRLGPTPGPGRGHHRRPRRGLQLPDELRRRRHHPHRLQPKRARAAKAATLRGRHHQPGDAPAPEKASSCR